MKLVEVIKQLEQARDNNQHGFIEVTIPGQEDTEYIVNKPRSIENKIEYYRNTYDDNGIHKHCPAIKIVGAGVFIWD